MSVTIDAQTIQYTYDAISRLLEANYNGGAQVFTYDFNVADNLTKMIGASRHDGPCP